MSRPTVHVNSLGDGFASWVAHRSGDASVRVSFYVRDREPPPLVIEGPSSIPIPSNQVTISGSTEPFVTVRIANQTLVANESGHFANTAYYPEGPSNITVTAADRDGNVNESWVTFTVDTVAPSLSVTSPADGTAFATRIVAVTGQTEADALLVVAGLVTPVDPSGAFSANLTLLEGNQTIVVHAIDAARNVATVTVNILVDVTPPSLDLQAPAGNLSKVTEVEFAGTADPGSTVTVGGQAVPLDGFDQFSTLVSLNEGQNLVLVRAVDAVGNARSRLVAVWVDLMAPSLSLTSPVNGSTTFAGVVNVSGVTEADARASVNGIPVEVQADGSINVQIALFPGPNVVTAEAVDLAGNRASVTVEVFYESQVRALQAAIAALQNKSIETGAALNATNLALENATRELDNAHADLAAASASLNASQQALEAHTQAVARLNEILNTTTLQLAQVSQALNESRANSTAQPPAGETAPWLANITISALSGIAIGFVAARGRRKGPTGEPSPPLEAPAAGAGDSPGGVSPEAGGESAPASSSAAEGDLPCPSCGQLVSAMSSACGACGTPLVWN